MAATIFAAWWTQAQLVWTVCLRLYPTAVEINLKTTCICKVKLDISPPGYTPSHLRPFTSMHHFSLRPATNTHYFFYRTLRHPIWWMSQTPKLGNSVLWLNSKKPTKIGLSRQRHSTDRKTNFKIQIDHLQPYFYQPCKLGKDRSGRCWDNRCGRNR